MACTALKVDDIRIKFMTNVIEAPSKDGSTIKPFLNVELYICDEDFIPEGNTSKSIIDREEEAYHRDLREQAFKKGHYIPEESTDPEWNPKELQIEEESDGSSL